VRHARGWGRHDGLVPWSYYKGEPLGKAPPCAICAGPGRGARGELDLGYGVRVWLCEAHRSSAFLAGRMGRDLVVSLMYVWQAAGCMTRRRHLALERHVAALRRRGQARARPGSYAWPELRRQVERRAAAGITAREIGAEVRSAHEERGVRAPSGRTIRRWIAERRWLEDGGGEGGGRPGRGPRPRPPGRRAL